MTGSLPDYSIQDAIQNALVEEEDLSPHSQTLFPATNIHMNSLKIETMLNVNEQLQSLLLEYQDVFISNGKPTNVIEHSINTLDHPPRA